MLTAVLAIVALGAACALWALLQRWIGKTAPDLPGIERSCSGCAHSGTCNHSCRSEPISKLRKKTLSDAP